MSAVSFGRSRKVRTPQGRMPDNIRNGEPQGEVIGRATERNRSREGVRVKRWCKRPPASAAMQAARQPPSGARSSRDKRLPASFESRVDCMSGAVMYRLERCSSMKEWSLRGYPLFGQNAAYRSAW
jgi:hypothetical protein